MRRQYEFSRRALFLCALVAAPLAGCATIELSLSASELASLRIEEVDVSVTPETAIWWGNAEREFVGQVEAGKATVAGAPVKKVAYTEDATAQQNEDYNRIAESSEAKQFQRDKLTSMIKDRLQKQVLPNFQGTRPARLELKVLKFAIPSPLQRLALGGMPELGIITVLRDTKTGREIGKLDRMTAAYAGNGWAGVLLDQALSDLEDRVLDAYVEQVKGWLSPK